LKEKPTFVGFLYDSLTEPRELKTKHKTNVVKLKIAR